MAWIVVLVVCSFLAVPLFYRLRMQDGVFVGGILAFVGVPLLGGILQKQAHRSITFSAAVFLLLCPVVYAVTDPLAVQFEILRDCFFLATGSTIVFVTSVFLASSLKPPRVARIVISGMLLLLSSVAVITLLWMIMYFE